MKQILIVEDDSFLNKMLDYNLLTSLGQVLSIRSGTIGGAQ